MTAGQRAGHEPVQSTGAKDERNRGERMIESAAAGLGNGIGWLAESGLLFGLFALIWIVFAAGLVWSHGTLDQAWQTIRELPLSPDRLLPLIQAARG